MKKLFLLVLSISPLFSEISVFGAGDLSSDSPYGLTESEKQIVENRESIENVSKETKKIDTKVETLNDTVRVLRELIQNVGRQNVEHQMKISKLMDDLKQNHLITEIKYKEISENISSTQSQVKKQEEETAKSLNDKIKESFQRVNSVLLEQEKRLQKIEEEIDRDFKSIQNKLLTIHKDIETINSNYVTQKQLDFVVSEFNAFKETVIGEFEKMSKYQDDYYDFAKHSNPDIFKDGVEMFRLAKYKEAIKLFKHLITKHYRPATDNFYIGESYYYLNEYSLAVKHYKDSVSIYDKSSFMPTLLLHSAISLEKIGDSREAQIFYKVLQTQYGDTPEGKKASELISN